MQSLADAHPQIALGALDGRYRPAVAPLVDHLSEPALNRMRVHVEVEWLIHLTDAQVVPGVRRLTDEEQARLREVVTTFGPDEIDEMAATEKVTQHDVKAVEYFLKARLREIAPADEDTGLAELIHFCCTSEDINNLSYALMVQGAVRDVWLPRATALVEALATMASDLREVPLLAHTHGQPATPTTMGKELAVLTYRLQRQLRRIEGAEYLGKINGATGTFGAHLAAVPDQTQDAALVSVIVLAAGFQSALAGVDSLWWALALGALALDTWLLPPVPVVFGNFNWVQIPLVALVAASLLGMVSLRGWLLGRWQLQRGRRQSPA